MYYCLDFLFYKDRRVEYQERLDNAFECSNSVHFKISLAKIAL